VQVETSAQLKNRRLDRCETNIPAGMPEAAVHNYPNALGGLVVSAGNDGRGIVTDRRVQAGFVHKLRLGSNPTVFRETQECVRALVLLYSFIPAGILPRRRTVVRPKAKRRLGFEQVRGNLGPGDPAFVDGLEKLALAQEPAYETTKRPNILRVGDGVDSSKRRRDRADAYAHNSSKMVSDGLEPAKPAASDAAAAMNEPVPENRAQSCVTFAEPRSSGDA
jgi:hypothetical protein